MVAIESSIFWLHFYAVGGSGNAFLMLIVQAHLALTKALGFNVVTG